MKSSDRCDGLLHEISFRVSLPVPFSLLLRSATCRDDEATVQVETKRIIEGKKGSDGLRSKYTGSCRLIRSRDKRSSIDEIID